MTRSLSRRTLLHGTAAAAGALALGGLSGCGPRESNARPNVLVLLASGWRGQDLGFLTGGRVRTPNLDRLAAGGVHLVNAFANTPVAASARASLLTGKYALDHGVLGNSLPLAVGHDTFARSLTMRGWRSSYIGTWRLAGHPESTYVPPGPARQGFDEYWAQAMKPFDHNSSILLTDRPPPLVAKEYGPTTFSNLAIERLGQHVASGTVDPFQLTVSYGPPHPPFEQVPDEHLAVYTEDELSLPPSFQPSDVVPDGDAAGSLRRLRAYYAQCTALDAEIGRVLDELDRLELADNTVVVFTSDHGTLLGEHGLSAAQQPFDESIRVPLIVRWPRRLRVNASSKVLFSSIDLAPTLLGLCDAPIPSSMRGRDLGFALHGRTGILPEAVYCQEILGIGALNVHRTFSWRALRTPRYLYAEDLSGPWLLFDLERDPYQLENLVSARDQRPTVHALGERLRKVYARLGEQYRTPLEHLEATGQAAVLRQTLNTQLARARGSMTSRVLRAYLEEGTTWTNPRYLPTNSGTAADR
ncbi:MAG: sulfatase [Planctomycetota bacterium]